MGLSTLRYADLGLDDPVGIVGFPSVGLVSSIAANYYATQLEMVPVMAFHGDSMPPYCLIARGSAYPPIRMYGAKSRTKTGRDVVVCTSEYAPKPDDCYLVGTTVLEGLRDLGCRDVVCLEGVPRGSEDDSPVICGSGSGVARLIERSGLPRMDGGMVKGITGIMMYMCQSMGMNVATVLCPANPTIPDPASAAAFVDPLSRMVKGLKVSSRTLIEEGDEIRRRMEETNVGRDPSENALYG